MPDTGSLILVSVLGLAVFLAVNFNFLKNGQTIGFHRLYPLGSAARGAHGVDLAVALATKAKRPGRKPKRARPARGKRAGRPAVPLPTSGHSATLVARLRAWRLEEARRRRVPAFRVLTNRALVALADARPTTPAALRNVTGIGPKVVQTYQSVLLGLCLSGEAHGGRRGG